MKNRKKWLRRAAALALAVVLTGNSVDFSVLAQNQDMGTEETEVSLPDEPEVTAELPAMEDSKEQEQTDLNNTEPQEQSEPQEQTPDEDAQVGEPAAAEQEQPEEQPETQEGTQTEITADTEAQTGTENTTETSTSSSADEGFTETPAGVPPEEETTEAFTESPAGAGMVEGTEILTDGTEESAVSEEEKRTVLSWNWIDTEELLEKTETGWILVLPGASRENPAKLQDVETLLPEEISAVLREEDASGEETEKETVLALDGWSCEDYPEEGAYEGSYTFTAELPGDCYLGTDAEPLEVTVQLGGIMLLATARAASPTLDIADGNIFLGEENGVTCYYQTKNGTVSGADDYTPYAGTITITGSGSYFLQIQSGTHTVLMQNASIKPIALQDGNRSGGSAVSILDGSTVNLILESTNEWKGSSSYVDEYGKLSAQYGLYVKDSSLSISGSGSLKIQGGDSLRKIRGVGSAGIYVFGSQVTMNGSIAVDVSGGDLSEEYSQSTAGDGVRIRENSSFSFACSKLKVEGRYGIIAEDSSSFVSTGELEIQTTVNAAVDCTGGSSAQVEVPANSFARVKKGNNASRVSTTYELSSFSIASSPKYLSVSFGSDLYSLTLDGGTGAQGGGSYFPGTQVSVFAGTRTGYTFEYWESSGKGKLADMGAAETVFTMGESDATIQAIFAEGSVEGDFVVSSTDSGYTYEDGELSINGSGTYSIRMKSEVTSTSDHIRVGDKNSPTIILRGVQIVAVGNSDSALEFGASKGTVTLKLEGTNRLQKTAGRVGNAIRTSMYGGNLVITSLAGDGETSGSLEASSTTGDAVIGGAGTNTCSNIEIRGGTITVKTDQNGRPAIGARRDVENIRITGGHVTATGGWNGAAIGSYNKDTSGIVIADNALIKQGKDRASEITDASAVVNGTKRHLEVSFGDGTIGSTVTGVGITPGEAEVIQGETQQFSAEVSGGSNANKRVNWSVSGNTSASTKIENGLLTVGGDEEAGQLTVTVTSQANGQKKASAVVTVVPSVITLTEEQMELTMEGWTYGGTPAKPQASVKDVEGDFSITYSYRKEGSQEWTEEMPSAAGHYQVRAMFRSETHEGEKTAGFTIEKAVLTPVAAVLSERSYDTTKAVSVTEVSFDGLVNGDTLAVGTDYTAEAAYEDADARTDKPAQVTVALNGTSAAAANYRLDENSLTASGTVHPKEVTDPVIELEKETYEYTGSVVEPRVLSVKDADAQGSGYTVIPDNEYTVEYEANDHTGTGTVRIADREGGNYTVSGSITFTIFCLHSQGCERDSEGVYRCVLCGTQMIASVTAGENTSCYEDIHAAWEKAAEESGEVMVTLLADAEVSATLTVTSGSNITLKSETDGNGDTYTISGNVFNASSGLINIASGGTLTLESGTVKNGAGGNNAIAVNGGHFVLNGGTAAATADGHSGVCVYNRGTAQIRTGNVSGDIGVAAASDGSTITISDGNISGRASGVYVSGSGAKITITGGTISASNTKEANGADGAALRIQRTGSALLSGGTYSGANGILIDSGNSITLKELLYADEDVKYAYYSNGVLVTEGLNGKTLTGPLTVGECEHSCSTWTDNGDGENHSGTCVVCGYKETRPHDWNTDGKCKAEGCTAQAAVSVTVNGGEPAYYATIEKAWLAAKGHPEGATVTLRSDVTAASALTVDGDDNIILTSETKTDGSENYSISGNSSSIISISGGSLTLKKGSVAGREMYSSSGVKITGGSFYMESGSVSGYMALDIQNGEVYISGGSVKGDTSDGGYGINAIGGKIELTGGTYYGESAAITNMDSELHGVAVGNLLAKGYAFKQNDLWVSDITVSELKGTVTVEEAPMSISPAATTITYGDVAPTLTATVTQPDDSTNGVTYQWYLDGKEIAGATGETYTPDKLDAGEYVYTCTATVDGYSLPGTAATITVNRASIENAVVTIEQDSFIYDGTGHKPTVTVVKNENILTEGTDYTVTYEKNVDAGTASATITAVENGNYYGTRTVEFKIEKATPDLGTVGYTGIIYPDTVLTDIVLTRTDETVPGTLTLTEGQTLTAGIGAYDWTFIPQDTDNYNEVTGTVTLEVVIDPDATAYTITIPATAVAGGDVVSVGINKEEPFNLNGGTVSVSVSGGIDESGKLTLTNTDDAGSSVTSEMYVGEKSITSFTDRIFAVFESLDDSPVSLSFQEPTETGAQAGTYEGTVTFSIDYTAEGGMTE